MRGWVPLAAALVLVLCSTTSARADDTRAAPHRVAMPARTLRATAHRPRVAVVPRAAAPVVFISARPAPRATFVDRITRSVNDGESF